MIDFPKTFKLRSTVHKNSSTTVKCEVNYVPHHFYTVKSYILLNGLQGNFLDSVKSLKYGVCWTTNNKINQC